MSTEAPAKPRSRTSWYLIGYLAILFLSFGGFNLLRHFFPSALSWLPGGVSGSISVTGSPESWTMRPNACYSGESRQFLGVSFFDRSQKKLGGRIVVPVDDPTHVSLNTPTQGGSVSLGKDQCTTWDVDAHRTSSTYNGIWGVTGHARFDCTFDDPVAHFSGDIQFHSCH